MSTSLVLPPPPDDVDLEDALHRARLRVWAAGVRDAAPPEVARLARLLCITMDLLPMVAAPALRGLMESNARALAAKITAALG